MTYTFEANGKSYKTDKITIQLMRQYRGEDNDYMLGLIFEIGLSYGKIVELTYTGTGSDYLDCVLGVGGFEQYGPIKDVRNITE